MPLGFKRSRRGAHSPRAEYHPQCPRCGESEHTGSVAAASCASRNAWQRQPPKSCSRRSQLRQSSGIQSTPRIFLKRDGLFPDLPERALLDIFKRHSGQNVRRVARQDIAIRLDEENFAPPAAHAGLGIFRVVVRDHKFHVNAAAEAFFGAFQNFERAVELRARGQQSRAIGKGPAVILDVGELDAPRRRFFR